MPKTKNGGFIIDDSNLNPYHMDVSKKKKQTATKNTTAKKTGTKKKNAR